MIDISDQNVYYWFVVSDYWTVVMLMVMKVRRTQEWDIPDLHTKLQKAAGESSKSITQICKEAELSTAFWYELAKGRKNSISLEALERLCKVLDLTLKDIGVDQIYWYSFERDTLKDALSAETLKAIEKALGVSFEVEKEEKQL